MATETLKNEISHLKKKREAVILAHNYKRPEVPRSDAGYLSMG